MTAAASLPRLGSKPRGGAIDLVGLRKEHGDVVAVDNIDLSISAGEFFSLLGPSGCGKTTTLRMIGGFDLPTRGQVLLDGVDIVRVPVHKRPTNTVFQSYALFPHLTVAENVGYGLRWGRGLDRSQRRAKVSQALELVRLTKHANRKPHQLSGGEQQRVALARALVCDPAVLLLDEPFGALDAKLRKALRGELSAIQKEVGTTFVFVTHDQEEALEISDRIAVMDRGHVEQFGTPKDIYTAPQTEFTADFLGLANLLDVQCLSSATSGQASVRLGEFALTATCVNGAAPGPGRVVIRPERVRLATGAVGGDNAIPGMVDNLVYVGATTQVAVRLAHGPVVHALVVNDNDRDDLRPGTPVTLTLPADALRLLVQHQPADAAAQDTAGRDQRALIGT